MGIPARVSIEIVVIYHHLLYRELTSADLASMSLHPEIIFTACIIRIDRPLPVASYIGCKVVRMQGYEGPALYVPFEPRIPIQVVGNCFTDEEHEHLVMTG